MSQLIAVAASLSGRDKIQITEESAGFQWKVIGCRKLLKAVHDYAANLKGDTSSWPVPAGEEHTDLLLREAILKARGEWLYPYTEEELCHCRLVPTATVDRAIIAGAHTPEAVKQQTSASSACGTCRHNIEAIIKFRLAS